MKIYKLIKQTNKRKENPIQVVSYLILFFFLFFKK